MVRLRYRRIGAASLVLLALAAAAAWWMRDLPRRRVEARLADTLQARVRLGALEILGRERFLLHDLEIERVAAMPWLERASVEALLVEGPLRKVLAGRPDSLRLTGTELRLVPERPPGEAVESGAAPPSLRVGRLLVERARVLLASESGEALIHAEASLADLGGRPSGEIVLESARLPLGVLLAFAGAEGSPILRGSALEELRVELRLDGGRGETTVAAEVRQAHLRIGPRSIGLSGPRLRGRLTSPRENADRLRFEMESALPPLGSGRLSGEWDRSAGRPAVISGELRGVDVARLLPDLGLDAEAEVKLDGAGDRLGYRLSARPRRFAPPGGLELEAEGAELVVEGSLALPLARITGPLEATLVIPTARGSLAGRALPTRLFPLRAAFDGRLSATAEGEAGGALEGTTRIETGSFGTLAARGRLAAAQGQTSADLAWRWQGATLEALLVAASELGLPAPGSVQAKGRVGASGTLAGSLARPAVEAVVTLEGVVGRGRALAGRPAAEEVPVLPRGGRVSAGGRSGRLATTASADGILAGVQGERTGAPAASVFEDPPGDPVWRFEGGRALARLTWSEARSGLVLQGLEAEGELALGRRAPIPVKLEAAGMVGADRSSASLKGSLGAGDLGETRWGVSWARGGRPAWKGTFSVERAPLAGWFEALAPPPGEAREAEDSRGLLADLALQGEASTALDFTFDEDGRWTAEGSARVSGVGFASEDGSRVLEGLDSSWTLRADGLAGGSTHASASGSLGGFALLWGALFADLSGLESTVELAAERSPSAAWKLRGGWRVPGGLALDAAVGGDREEELVFDAALSVEDVGEIYERHLRPSLAGGLGDLEVAGALRLRLSGEERPGSERRLAGEVEVDGLSLTRPSDGLALEGVGLHLPVDLRWRPDEQGPSGERRDGEVRWSRVAWGGVEIPPLAGRLAVEADRVSLEEPLVVPLFGGRLTLERLALGDLLRPTRHLASTLALSGVRFEEVSAALGLVPLDGELEARLPEVRLDADRLTVAGGGEAEVFGGKVLIGDISGRDVLSRFPRLTFSADFRDLDLGRLTRRLEFGEMTGMLQGHIRDCELFRGVPVRFEARLETVERPGVPRVVSVKAINNLAILGTGQKTSVLDRGLRRFFKRYTYSRLGVEMRLADDVFELRGLERRGGRELFLRGRLPFPIDVVNAQPGRTVSFQVMLRRLGSLDLEAATVEP